MNPGPHISYINSNGDRIKLRVKLTDDREGIFLQMSDGTILADYRSPQTEIEKE